MVLQARAVFFFFFVPSKHTAAWYFESGLAAIARARELTLLVEQLESIMT